MKILTVEIDAEGGNYFGEREATHLLDPAIICDLAKLGFFHQLRFNPLDRLNEFCCRSL